MTDAPHFIDTPAAGRLAIMPAPIKTDLALVRAAGVDCVVSLLTEGEAERLDLLDEAARCRRHGMDFVSYPIRDFSVPESLALAVKEGSIHLALRNYLDEAAGQTSGVTKQELLGLEETLPEPIPRGRAPVAPEPSGPSVEVIRGSERSSVSF